jgi:N utilization substance protein B
MARFYAVQMIYSAELTGATIEPNTNVQGEFNDCEEIFITEDLSTTEMDLEFYQKLINVANRNLPEIDAAIIAHLTDGWKMNRLDSVMRAILRLGTAELLYLKEVPSNVVFNEYLELSKSFFEKKDTSFINGLLNSVLIASSIHLSGNKV